MWCNHFSMCSGFLVNVRPISHRHGPEYCHHQEGSHCATTSVARKSKLRRWHVPFRDRRATSKYKLYPKLLTTGWRSSSKRVLLPLSDSAVCTSANKLRFELLEGDALAARWSGVRRIPLQREPTPVQSRHGFDSYRAGRSQWNDPWRGRGIHQLLQRWSRWSWVGPMTTTPLTRLSDCWIARPGATKVLDCIAFSFQLVKLNNVMTCSNGMSSSTALMKHETTT